MSSRRLLVLAPLVGAIALAVPAVAQATVTSLTFPAGTVTVEDPSPASANEVRQLGAVLGIAILVAVLAAGTPADLVGPFHDAQRLMAIAGLASGALALGLGRVRARDPEAALAPAPAPAR